MHQDMQRYLTMLQSSDVNQRKQAIIALGKSGDKLALSPLAKIYRTDPDPALRELALKAGRHIQKQLGGASSTQTQTTFAVPSSGTTPQESPAFLSAGSGAAVPSEVPDWMQKMGSEVQVPKKVTDRDRQRARSLKDRALDAQLRGEMEKVVDLLAEAIDLNPELERDTIVIGLLAQATGMDGEQAIKELKRLSAEDAAAGKKRKKTSDMSWHETIDFVVEMAIWFIVLGLFMSGIMFAAFKFTSDFAASQPATSPEEAQFNEQLDEYFDRFGPLFSLMFGFFYGALVTGISVFMSFLAWFTGITFLGGEGMLYPFLRAMMRVTIVVIFIATAASIGSFLFSNPSTEVTLGLGFGPLLLGIGITAWTIGRVHNFGMIMGCVNMVATVFMCSALSCAINFLTAL